MTNTIDELMEGKFPGQITIVHTSGIVFIPYFIDNCSERWVGKDLDGVVRYSATDNWKIYEEPKKLVKKWLWAVKGSNGWVQDDFYYTEQEIQDGHYSEYQKLECSEIEVEDDQ